LYLSILCAEDTPFITEEDLAQLKRETLAGDGTVRALMRTCAPWPQGQVDAASRELPTGAKPVLLISGELDPITPVSQAAMAAEALPASRHVVMRATGHSGAANPCAVGMIEHFIEAGAADQVDDACAEQSRRPRWVTPLPEPPAPFR
jgi:pimeloyl-ACP methyl ester carboxylesterase